MIPAGRRFFKMSGSGNDFVFVDALHEPPGALSTPEVIRSVCARATGVGADGIVFLLPSTAAALRMRYLNSDGSLAEMCGNAALCTTRLAVELGVVPPETEFSFETDSGVVRARFKDGAAQIDLSPVTEVQDCFAAPPAAGERRLGFATVGVPHIVVLCDDVERQPVVERGRQLRHDAKLPHGANVNFVSKSGGGVWRMRTYERGVEAETLACGTGAVATALLLSIWGQAAECVEIRTSSGRTLGVSLKRAGTAWHPSLSGEARIVFTGAFGELDRS